MAGLSSEHAPPPFALTGFAGRPPCEWAINAPAFADCRWFYVPASRLTCLTGSDEMPLMTADRARRGEPASVMRGNLGSKAPNMALSSSRASAEKGVRPPRMARADRGVDVGGRAWRPDDVCSHRRHARIEPKLRPRVHLIRQDASLGPAQAETRSAMNVMIYVDISKQVGDKDHLKVFANEDAAETWFQENDPEGVAFEYEVIGPKPSPKDPFEKIHP